MLFLSPRRPLRPIHPITPPSPSPLLSMPGTQARAPCHSPAPAAAASLFPACPSPTKSPGRSRVAQTVLLLREAPHWLSVSPRITRVTASLAPGWLRPSFPAPGPPLRSHPSPLLAPRTFQALARSRALASAVPRDQNALPML